MLPLKLWRPRWFDGVALAAGAVAPDVAYLALDADGRLFADTHAWPAQLWWCLPVALAYTWAVRRTIATVAVHLPAGRRLTWRAYADLAHHRHRWPITAGSCLLGAASHVAWDHLTHTDGWIHTVFGVRWAEVSPIPGGRCPTWRARSSARPSWSASRPARPCASGPPRPRRPARTSAPGAA